MTDDAAALTQRAVGLFEQAATRVAAVSLELGRSQAWNDLLGTIDRLSSLLGADPGPAPSEERVPSDVQPAEIARLVTGWLKSLLLPEYLRKSGSGRALYRVRLPEEARADGLGELVDLLEALALRLELRVEGDVARLALSVGEGETPAVAVACANDRLEIDLDLGATRGALRHIVALAGRLPAARGVVEGLRIGDLSGFLRASFEARGGDGMRLACALREPLLLVGKNDEGPLRVGIAPSEILAIEGEARGALRASVELGAVRARVPASMVDEGASGTAEYRLERASGQLVAARGDRALKLRGLTLGGQPAVSTRDGRPVASLDLRSVGVGLDLEPTAPDRFVLASEGDLVLTAGGSGREVTVSVPAGTRLDVGPGGISVQAGRLLLSGPGAAVSLEVGVGRTLVRRKDPRPGETHPVLALYESVSLH